MKKWKMALVKSGSVAPSIGSSSIAIGKGISSGPSREGPGVGHKIVSDAKQMTKRERKRKKEWDKGKWMEINRKRYRNALRNGRRQKY